MKIIVMDSANVRIEVLNVPDHMIEEDIEQFLAEHDYSLNNISWMAAPIDFVPVQFHEYGICHSDGEELHFVRQGKLKDFSIYDSVQEVKHREQEELAEQLKEVQKLMEQGDERARKIFDSIGVCFGYTIARWCEFYDIAKLLILGRVTSGKGGDIILARAADVLKSEFPEYAGKVEFRIPDEKSRRHGQAVAAASLPVI